MSWPRQIVFESALTASEITAIDRLAMLKPMSTEDHTIIGNEIRLAQARWLERDQDSEFIFDLLTELITAANHRFKYDIDYIRERVMHVTYPVGGHFIWHTDTSGVTATRKLSISILLSDPGDFDGGALEFCPGGALKNGNTRGSAVVFPAYMAHR